MTREVGEVALVVDAAGVLRPADGVTVYEMLESPWNEDGSAKASVRAVFRRS